MSDAVTTDPVGVGLICPAYGRSMHTGTAAGFYGASMSGAFAVHGFVEDSSILPHAFNKGLTRCLDLRDKGQVTHLAMIHADVAPEPGWLDVLYREMQANQADLISAVIPITSPQREETSTAAGKRKDPWAKAKYIKANDRDRLPITFGPEHVCNSDEILLVNTGLFLADLTRPYWNDFAFGFANRIATLESASGSRRRVAQCIPEDWAMSHHVQASGGRVVATWAVKATHYGSAAWPNWSAETSD